ncbi:MAG: hypothetical protein JSR66_15240 [Proteobacteria bacterium]|nr:hypothetical protein [Pseudomonadota bacterium]
MDDKAIRRLDEHAHALARKLGVHASVSFEEADVSQVEPTGPRLVLTVYHDETDRRSIHFRPDQPHLLARIEQEIPLLAQELGQQH